MQADQAATISREEVINLPIRRYEGDIHLIATAQDLEQAMADIRRESVIGLDTETRPAFTKGESHLPCLVQVGTARAVYLFQLQRVDCSEALSELLAAPGIVKAGIALAHDLRRRGIAGEAAEAVLRPARDSEPLDARALLRRRFPEPPADAAERARRWRFLQARGFAPESIRAALAGPAAEDDH